MKKIHRLIIDIRTKNRVLMKNKTKQKNILIVLILISITILWSIENSLIAAPQKVIGLHFGFILSKISVIDFLIIFFLLFPPINEVISYYYDITMFGWTGNPLKPVLENMKQRYSSLKANLIWLIVVGYFFIIDPIIDIIKMIYIH